MIAKKCNLMEKNIFQRVICHSINSAKQLRFGDIIYCWSLWSPSSEHHTHMHSVETPKRSKPACLGGFSALCFPGSWLPCSPVPWKSNKAKGPSGAPPRPALRLHFSSIANPSLVDSSRESEHPAPIRKIHIPQVASCLIETLSEIDGVSLA